jgi:FkbM family methyltransferase
MNARRFLWITYEDVIIPALRPLFGGTILGRLGELGVRHGIRILCLIGPIRVEGSLMRVDECGDIFADWFEREATQFIKAMLRPGMTAVDVGAHIGYYTLLASRCVGPEGRVYAFEPHPQNYKKLQENAKRNAYRNIALVPKAISHATGTAKLHRNGGSMGDSLYAPDTPQASMSVDTTTLDDFFRSLGWPDVHLLKIDIEGGEWAALEGASELLRRSSNLCLVCEYLPELIRRAGRDPEAFRDYLVTLGCSTRTLDDINLVASVKTNS